MLNPRKVEYFAIKKYNTQYLHPEYLYYCFVDFEEVSDTGGPVRITLRFDGPHKKKLLNSGSDLERIQSKIAEIGIPPPGPRAAATVPLGILARKDKDRGNRSLKSLKINKDRENKPCYFAFILSGAVSKWYFDLYNLGVTLEKASGLAGAGPHDRVDQIMFFNERAEQIELGDDYKFENEANKNEKGCRAVAFGLRQMAAGESRKVNLHVVLEVSATECVPTIFDPDIKNDGGQFP